MIEQIQLTALLFFVVSWMFISATKESDLNTWVMAIILFIWGSSGIAVFGVTLYRIWS